MGVKREFFRCVLPSTAAFALAGVYAIVDGYFVGNTLGDNGLAAINLAYPVAAFFSAVGADREVPCSCSAVTGSFIKTPRKKYFQGATEKPRSLERGGISLCCGTKARADENSFPIRTIPSVREFHPFGGLRLSQTLLPVGNFAPPQRIVFSGIL